MGLKNYIKEGIREIDEDDKRPPSEQNVVKEPPSPLPSDPRKVPEPLKT
jgi:hypothetical protein